MDLDVVLRGVDLLRRAGKSPGVTGVEYDSRRVRGGSLFVAFRGGTTDGNLYIPQAIAQGASAIVTDSAAGFATATAISGRRGDPSRARPPRPRCHCRKFLRPSRSAAQTQRRNRHQRQDDDSISAGGDAAPSRAHTVLAGTIEYHAAGRIFPAPHTTPESRDLLELFREGVDGGATEAVMEVSSHALEQERISGLLFDVAIFTNLTRDHLDYHGSMENYFAAKRKLFDGSVGSSPRVAILNQDDAYGAKLKAHASSF